MRKAIPSIQLFSLLSVLLAALLSACGGDDRGKTPCGIQTCQAGQHCLNLACIPGCQSNENCASDQTCQDIDSDSHVGTCRGGEGKPGEPMSTDMTCKTICDKLVQCGLFTWDEGVICQNGCAQWTTDQKAVYRDCATAWDCSGATAPACLGNTCGGKYGCRTGQCTQHSCF